MTPDPVIRILVVDDHTLFRRALTALLSCEPGLEVVGDAADAGEAQRQAERLQPDVILLDNHLPGVTGVQAVPALLAACPRCKVLILTVSDDERDLADALGAGASGYLLKTMEADALTQAIARSVRGDAVVSPEMTTKLVAALRLGSRAPEPRPQEDPMAELSPREREILAAIGRGVTNKEIAREFAIAESTVKIHVQHLFRKLEVSSRVHLAVIATNRGLV